MYDEKLRQTRQGNYLGETRQVGERLVEYDSQGTMTGWSTVYDRVRSYYDAHGNLLRRER